MSRRSSRRPRLKFVPARGVAQPLEADTRPTDVKTIHRIVMSTGHVTRLRVMHKALTADMRMLNE